MTVPTTPPARRDVGGGRGGGAARAGPPRPRPGRRGRRRGRPRGYVGLSGTGRAQAAALGTRLAAAGFRPDVVVTSVLPRAVETAAVLTPYLGLDPTVTTRDCDLCERHPGEADGLTWDQLVAQYGPLDPTRVPDRPMSPAASRGGCSASRCGPPSSASAPTTTAGPSWP